MWVEIRGFRSFGTEPRRLALDAISAPIGTNAHPSPNASPVATG